MDMMSSGAGLVSAGVQFAGKQANERQAKKIQSTGRRMTKRNRSAQLREMDEEGKNINRTANQMNTDIGSDAAGGDDGEGTASNFMSSQRKDSQSKVEGERKLRQDALGRQRALMESTWHDEDKIYKAQKRMARTQKYTDLASSLLNGGAGGLGK